jgi:hypothetical protein
VYYRPPTETEIDEAVDRLEALQRWARENVALQGRDPAAARVFTERWRDELARRGIRFGRYRLILAELERRHLVAIDGPFAQIINERKPARRAVSASA